MGPHQARCPEQVSTSEGIQVLLERRVQTEPGNSQEAQPSSVQPRGRCDGPQEPLTRHPPGSCPVTDRPASPLHRVGSYIASKTAPPLGSLPCPTPWGLTAPSYSHNALPSSPPLPTALWVMIMTTCPSPAELQAPLEDGSCVLMTCSVPHSRQQGPHSRR